MNTSCLGARPFEVAEISRRWSCGSRSAAPPDQVLTVDMLLPPTGNQMTTVARGRRILSAKHLRWRQLVYPNLQRLAEVRRMTGAFGLILVVERPDRRRRDLDNYVKATLDALVNTGLVEDDHLCERLLVAWSQKPPAKGALARATIIPWTIGSAD